MRIKDINEKDDKRVRSAFGRGMGKGWQATQKGGWLAPDSLERGIKKFFTDPGADPDGKTKDKDTKKVKGGAGTADTVKKSKEKDPKKTVDTDKNVSNSPLNIKDPIPDTAQFMDGKIKFKYDAKKGEWISNAGRTLSAQDGVKAYNKTHKNYRQYVVKNETKEENMSKAIKEGLADLAGRAEADHEVQMARADLYKIAKYAIKLHDMLKNVSEERGMEGWQQAKITKAADYIGSVYHNLDYDMKFGDQSDEIGPDAEMQMGESRDTHCSDKCCGSDVKAEDCTCPPTCKHCNCNAKNVNEAKSCNCGPDCACGGNCGSNCNCGPDCGNVTEGKSPHKKGSTKYKKHMAAMHAEADNPEDDYKKRIGKKLRQKLRASLQPQKIEPQQIAPKEYEPNTGGHPTGS